MSENFQGSNDSGLCKGRWIADLETSSSRDGYKICVKVSLCNTDFLGLLWEELTVVHLKPSHFITSPPPTQPWPITIFTLLYSFNIHFTMLLVDEQSSDGAGSGVDIFVIAPGSEIYVPIMETDIDVADSMGKVPAYEKTL